MGALAAGRRVLRGEVRSVLQVERRVARRRLHERSSS